MLRTNGLPRSLPILAIILTAGAGAYAHVTVRPRESGAGISEKYTMRVPTERAVSTVRVEIEFPVGAEISSFEEKPGWKIEPKKDASGKIVGAIWSGSIIPPRQVVEFGFVARNPAEETKLVWKVIQIYEDGGRSEWTGEQGSPTPAPVTIIKKVSADSVSPR